MSKDEGPGLLAKVVKFVRNPTTSWSALDHEESDRESSYSKQMLKEMIERKRRNDFVRKREFDMLRKMRRSEAISSQDPAARPSFFQSSLPSKPDDRATTLKKIDEIEAQMSMQWWKTKHGDNASRSGAGVPAEAPRRPVDPASQAYNRTEPMPLAPVSRFSVQQDSPPMMEEAPVSQRPASGPASRSPVLPEPVPPRAAARGLPTPDTVPMSTGFNSAHMQAVQVDEFAHDPELEEAAIRFANGDIAGTEEGLREVLGPGGPRTDHDETWLALFDLYRATGMQERFESAAIEFAARFNRSAPQWFSLPEAVGRMQQPAVAPATGKASAHWTSPPVFGIQSLAALGAALAKAEPPWRLSWAKLQSIEPAVVEPLTRQFTQWGREGVQLRFIGTSRLEEVLRQSAPSGDKRVDPAWWRLRMEVLRVMHRPDEFELAALDYCVTYEVSPPSWESARCEFKPLQDDGSYESGHTIVGEAFHDSIQSSFSNGFGESRSGDSTGALAHVATVELAGQVLGDAHEAMQLIEQRLDNADIMVISCARLIRIDFTAAGMLLNWCGARQAEGRQVQFTDAHRLVAAFFSVIGINEHARVSTRND
ncbi:MULTISPECIES: STAS domain-containing protein [Ramlibacter]|uniref:STAS domain-containing protein n=1 Tax=Ramlibacter aquaticus TaxID=2780094 RepID=A0ABR9SDR8_9BURK|nr:MULTISPECIES: STAS domain-containing protein [Ramlibacter]MBE7940497.1 STAS domain-containing protein [Ramlibacter aquaticus]